MAAKKNARFQGVRAAGGSREILDSLVDICATFEFGPLETIYVAGRLIPILRDSYEAAEQAERATIRYGTYGLMLPFSASMVSLISSGFVPPAYQGYSLVFLGLFSGLHTLLIGYLTLNQPGLTWISARRTFTGISRELSLWLADVGVYDGLEQNAKFQLLQTRCEATLGQVEDAVSRQIQSLLTVAVDTEKPPEKPKVGLQTSGVKDSVRDVCRDPQHPHREPPSTTADP